MSPIPGARPPESAVPSDAGEEQVLPTEVPPAGDLSLTKIGESITEISSPVTADATSKPAKRLGRPPRASTAPVTWSVRGVSKEARAALEQGAAQAGKTLGQYISEDVRALVEQQLEASQPAGPLLQAEIQYLRRLVENLTVMLGGEPPRPDAPPGHYPKR